jgi:hypothetical protein
MHGTTEQCRQVSKIIGDHGTPKRGLIKKTIKREFGGARRKEGTRRVKLKGYIAPTNEGKFRWYLKE